MGDMTHIDVGTLVELGNALEWHADRVEHLAACEACRAELATFAAARRSLAETIKPSAGFTDRVVAALPPVAERRGYGWIGLNCLLATGTTFFVIAMAAMGDAPIAIGPMVIAVSLFAGVLAAVRTAAVGSRVSAPV